MNAMHIRSAWLLSTFGIALLLLGAFAASENLARAEDQGACPGLCPDSTCITNLNMNGCLGECDPNGKAGAACTSACRCREAIPKQLSADCHCYPN